MKVSEHTDRRTCVQCGENIAFNSGLGGCLCSDFCYKEACARLRIAERKCATCHVNSAPPGSHFPKAAGGVYGTNCRVCYNRLLMEAKRRKKEEEGRGSKRALEEDGNSTLPSAHSAGANIPRNVGEDAVRGPAAKRRRMAAQDMKCHSCERGVGEVANFCTGARGKRKGDPPTCLSCVLYEKRHSLVPAEHMVHCVKCGTEHSAIELGFPKYQIRACAKCRRVSTFECKSKTTSGQFSYDTTRWEDGSNFHAVSCGVCKRKHAYKLADAISKG